MIDTKLRKYCDKIFEKAVQPLIALGMSPMQLTFLALGLGLLACLLTALDAPRYCPVILVLGSLSAFFDIADGTVARMTGKSSPLGAFFDLLFDRLVESLFVIAYAVSFPSTQWLAMGFLTLLIINFSAFLLAASLFENKGEKSIFYAGGLVERSETFLCFALMILFPPWGSWILGVFVILMAITAFIRFHKTIKFARENGLDGRVPSTF